jgi:flagellar biosynthetic protein FlhB
MSLYTAVAQVLAYIYRLRRDDLLDGKPIVMDDVPVPPNLRTR